MWRYPIKSAVESVFGDDYREILIKYVGENYESELLSNWKKLINKNSGEELLHDTDLIVDGLIKLKQFHISKSK